MLIKLEAILQRAACKQYDRAVVLEINRKLNSFPQVVTHTHTHTPCHPNKNFLLYIASFVCLFVLFVSIQLVEDINRKLIQEGDVFQKKSVRHYFLFNDIFILTKWEDNCYKVKFVCELRDTQLKETECMTLHNECLSQLVLDLNVSNSLFLCLFLCYAFVLVFFFDIHQRMELNCCLRIREFHFNVDLHKRRRIFFVFSPTLQSASSVKAKVFDTSSS